jgi:PAS domain S-box-containing protein
VNSEPEPPIATRLEEMQQRLHDIWAQAVDSSAPGFVPAPPALAAIGSAVEDLHVAAEEVGSAAQELESERLRYEEIFQLAPNGYLVTDGDAVIIEANTAAAELLEVQARALVGRTLASFIAPRYHALLDDMQASCRALRGPVSADDVEVVTAASALLRVSLRCGAARDIAGSVIGFRWIMHDLTERFQAEELARSAQMREAERLRDVAEKWKRVEEAKSQFLNLASHELRSPLTILGGYLSMMEAGTFGPFDDALGNVVALLAAKTREMNALVSDLLEAARLEEGPAAMAPVSVDLRDLTQQVVDDWRPLARPGQRIDVGGLERPLIVEADPARIRTALVNLVSNAIKYSPDGTEILCILARQGDRATVAVRDRGIGIGPEHRDILFTRFGRVVTPATSSIPGTGLGLYIARELARMHNGDISLESSPGEGSTFILALPIRGLASDAG